MDFQHARDAILALIRQKGRATNSEMLALIGSNRELFERIREELILYDLADDKSGVGLVCKGSASTPRISSNVGSSNAASSDPAKTAKLKVFLSYGRADAREVADRMCGDLAAKGYEVWRDTQQIRPGNDWQAEIAEGLQTAQIVIALLSPHAVRTSRTADPIDAVDSVCLSEIAYALFQPPTRPVIPVMAIGCVPPLAICHLDYVDMQGWRDSPDRYQAGLQRLVDYLASVKRGEKRYRALYHQLQPFDFAAFRYRKRLDFCGREWLFDQIDAWRTAHDGERALLIKGDPGVGKSAIVAELVHRNPDSQVIAYHCCQWDRSDTLEPWRFVRSLAGMIANAVPAYAALLGDPVAQDTLSEANCRADAGAALERGIFEPLQTLAAPAGGPRCILIDALDEALLAPPGSGTIVDVLASRVTRLPPWLRIVATTRKEAGVLDRLQRLRAHEIDTQSTENRTDLEVYVRRRIQTPNLAEKLAHARRPVDEVVKQLADKSEGNFLYVEQALEGIDFDRVDFDHLDLLPPGLSGLYAVRLQRQFPDQQSFAPVKKVLDVIVAAQEPLSKEGLAGALSLERDDELPRVLSRLGNYLHTIEDSSGVARYRFFHKSLSEWLTDPAREGLLHTASVSMGHGQLAAWAWHEYRADLPQLSPYCRRYLPTHLIGAKRWGDVESLLTNLAYLESRNAAGEIFSLALDFGAAVAELPPDRSLIRILKLLKEALGRDIHFIDRHHEDYPQGLFQCLWNSCWWYDCPEAACHYHPPTAGCSSDGPPWSRPEPKLSTLVQSWHAAKTAKAPSFVWLRTLRPPQTPLGGPLQHVFSGHQGFGHVASVAFSPDGKRIVSGSYDRTVKVWDAASGQEMLTLEGHTNHVKSVAFSPDGKRIVSGSQDYRIKVWDATNGQEALTLKGRTKDVNSVAFSPDGKRIVSGSDDKTIKVWDATSDLRTPKLKGHTEAVRSVAFSPDGKRIVSGSDDNTVKVWDATNGLETLTLKGHTEAVRSVAFNPDGKRIVSGSDDKTIKVWDARRGRETLIRSRVTATQY